MLREIFAFLSTNNVGYIIWHFALWTILSALLGLGLGLGTFFFVRARGGYQLDRPWSRWLRVLVCILNVVVFTLACGYIGLFEGTWRGIQEFAQKSSLVAELNAQFGKVEALFFAGVYQTSALVANQPGIKPDDVVKALDQSLDAFAAGKEEIPVQDFQKRLDSISQESVRQVIGVVERKVVQLAPSLKNWAQVGTLRHGLEALGGTVLHDQAKKGLRSFGLDEYFAHILSGLPEEAARSGNANTISFQEMSAYLGRDGLMPLVLKAVHSFVRSHQLLGLLVMALMLALPILGFKLARIRLARTSEPEPAEMRP